MNIMTFVEWQDEEDKGTGNNQTKKLAISVYAVERHCLRYHKFKFHVSTI